MRRIALVFLYTLTGAVHAQTLEEVFTDWFNDATNGFQNAMMQYGRTGNGYFNDIDHIVSGGWGNSIDYTVAFDVKTEGSLEEAYSKHAAELAQWKLLQGWETESSTSIHLPHNITYKRKTGKEVQRVTLKLDQNYDATKPYILSLSLKRDGTMGPKKYVLEKDTQPDPATGEVMSLLGRLKTKQGLRAFAALANDSTNGFENIIVEDSLTNGVYQIKPNYLNPKSVAPFIHVEEG